MEERYLLCGVPSDTHLPFSFLVGAGGHLGIPVLDRLFSIGFLFQSSASSCLFVLPSRRIAVSGLPSFCLGGGRVRVILASGDPP